MSRGGQPLAVVLADLSIGGLQHMAVRLALALDRAEFAPHVYTFDAGGPLEAELAAAGIPWRHLPRGPGADPAHARRLAAAFRQDGIALVHCHNITALFHGGRAARRAGRLPVLYTEHDRDLPGTWRTRLLHRWLARHVERCVAVSRRLAEALVRCEGFPADRTAALHNGCDDPRARFAGSRAEARARLGWDDGPVLLAVGSLTEVKRHLLLVEGLPRLRAAVPGLRLVIAGEGPLRGALQAADERAGPGACALLGNRDDVPCLLAAADLYVLPSRSEGLSLSLIEAHGAGRASVACDVGGNGEVLLHGVTGKLAPANNTPALLDACAELLTNGSAREACETAARARFLEAFTHARMVAGYAQIYRELLSRSAA